jgi:hypothetical protein
MQPESGVRGLLTAALVLCAAGCFSSHAAFAVDEAPGGVAPERASGPSLAGVDDAGSTCNAAPVLDDQVSRAIEHRITHLKARGGVCSNLAIVLESSYRAGQITLRPYMWRVGSLLASGEAKPNGEMIIAREIDSLNVGARTLADVVHSMEHEAAHIAFKVDNDVTTDRAEAYVRACKT